MKNKKLLIFFLVFITSFVFVSCDKAQGIDVAKIVFDIIGYIFSAVIGALGGMNAGIVKAKKDISKDPSNNYVYKK